MWQNRIYRGDEGSWDGEIILDYQSGPNINHKGHYKGKREVKETVSEWGSIQKTHLTIADFEDGRVHNPRKAGSLWKIKETDHP